MPPCLVWDLSEPVAPDFVLHLVVAIHKKRGCHDSRVLTCLHSIACQRRSRDIKLERALSLVPSFSPPRLSLSRAQVSLLGIDGIGGPNRSVVHLLCFYLSGQPGFVSTFLLSYMLPVALPLTWQSLTSCGCSVLRGVTTPSVSVYKSYAYT